MKKTTALLLLIFTVLFSCTVLTSCKGGVYDDLTVLETDCFETEEYGVAFRRGSDLAGKLDEMFASDFSDGTAARIASLYGLEGSIPSVFTPGGSTATGTEDSDYIKGKGVLTVGVTVFDGMDYQDAEGKWIGFDADMANRFAERLGVRAEFLEIEWDNKLVDLETKNIDCIWNGMTVTPAIEKSCEVTGSYMQNGQVLVVKRGTLTAVSDLFGKQVAVEGGSAGYYQATAALADVTIKEVPAQTDALLEVAAGTSDACVIDYVLAKSLLNFD